MKSRKTAAATALVLVLVLLLSACGASSKSDAGSVAWNGNSAYYSEMKSEASTPTADYAYSGGWAKESAGYADEESPESGQSSDAVYGKENVKLIYRAGMEVQTLDFDETVKHLEALVDEMGGYFESRYTDNGEYGVVTPYRSGSFVVRVPAENYKSFLNNVGEGCHVVNLSESVEDVGLEYYEVERRLETLYTKEERLQELLSQAATMTDIIDLEYALSDTEYEIDRYKSSLNRYDSLIGFSTVNISVHQVKVYEPAIYEEPTFGERISRAFDRGVDDFVYGFEDFVVWLVNNVFSIILVLVIIAVVIVLHPIRRIIRGAKKWASKADDRAEKRKAKKAERAARKDGKTDGTVSASEKNGDSGDEA